MREARGQYIIKQVKQIVFINSGVKIMFKKLLAILLMAGFVAGCNTWKGMGEDVERGGEKMQDSADKKK